MLKPADGRACVKPLVVDAMERGANLCPPPIVGVGIAGSAERTMLTEVKSLALRPRLLCWNEVC
jgi:tartrate dehydratase alpha subunit/fumarate hydratase class I-like protein